MFNVRVIAGAKFSRSEQAVIAEQQSSWVRERRSVSFRAGLTIAALVLTGCASDGVSSMTIASLAPIGSGPGANSCSADKPCELTGIITLQHRSGNTSWASLSDGRGCVPLLLPESVYRKWRYWSDKRVKVSGTALARTPDPEDAVVSSALYRDRWLPASICGESGLVVYVDRIERAR